MTRSRPAGPAGRPPMASKTRTSSPPTRPSRSRTRSFPREPRSMIPWRTSRERRPRTRRMLQGEQSHRGEVYRYVNHIYKLFIRCEIIGGSPTTSHEIQGVGFFAEDGIPDLSMTRIMPAQIARMFENLRQPDLPTEFD